MIRDGQQEQNTLIGLSENRGPILVNGALLELPTIFSSL